VSQNHKSQLKGIPKRKIKQITILKTLSKHLLRPIGRNLSKKLKLILMMVPSSVKGLPMKINKKLKTALRTRL
jgi:hypothetical protein